MLLPDPETLPRQSLFTVREICDLLHVRSVDSAYSYMREMGSEFMARRTASVTDGLIARIAAMDVAFEDGRCVVRAARGGNRGRARMREFAF